MPDDPPQSIENVASELPVTDWAEPRARAAKLGITLSELQQQEREKKMRLARKNQAASPQKDSASG